MDDFNPESLGLSDDVIRANEAAWKAKAAGASKAVASRARRHGHFSIAPIPWIHHVADALTSPAQFKVVHQMLYMVRLDKNPNAPAPVQVTAGKMREVGVSPEIRDRTLRRLESAGLVAVKWQRRAGPVVTFLFGQAPAPAWAVVLDAALQVAVQRTGDTRWRPAVLLAAIERPPGYTGKWPRTIKQLLAMLRQLLPDAVVIRKGRKWVYLGQVDS